MALQLESHFKRVGADVFLDALSIEAGGETDEAIRRALDQMDELVVLITPWSLERPYVWSELGVAWHRRVPIMGLLYGISVEELQKKPEVPHYLKGTNLKNLDDVDDYLAGLSKRAGRRLKS